MDYVRLFIGSYSQSNAQEPLLLESLRFISLTSYTLFPLYSEIIDFNKSFSFFMETINENVKRNEVH